MPPPTIATLSIRVLLEIEEREDFSNQLALLGELLRGQIAAERAAGDIDLALLADDDVKRLLEVARLGPVQKQLVVGKVRFDAAIFQGLRRLDRKSVV